MSGVSDKQNELINENKEDNLQNHENGEESKKEEEEEELLDLDSDNIELEAMENNKILFLSKDEINKMKEKQKQKEEYVKQEKEKMNARHKRTYLRTKNRYIKKLEKEKEI